MNQAKIAQRAKNAQVRFKPLLDSVLVAFGLNSAEQSPKSYENAVYTLLTPSRGFSADVLRSVGTV